MDDVFYPSTSKKARIEIIPLIDVVFFLLATFVLFTLSLNKIKILDVPLPKAGQPFEAEDLTVYIQTTDRGVFLWKQGRASSSETLTASELLPRLELYHHSVTKPRVLLNGDDRAPFSETIRALDAVRLAHIAEVSMETIRN
jgi:biopolymer transport protein ExbD